MRSHFRFRFNSALTGKLLPIISAPTRRALWPVLLLAAWLLPIQAGTFLILGPVRFVASGATVVVRKTVDFSAPDPTKNYTMRIDVDRISNVTVKLNNIDVVKPGDFTLMPRTITKQVQLLSNNRLTVELRGTAGTGISLQISVIENDPPSINAVVTPTPNGAGWNNANATVTFNCADATSGIRSCTSPVSVTTETSGRVVTGTAVDKAGNTATTSVTVKLDKTQPNLTVTSPANNSEVITPTVTIAGTVSDALSGVAGVTCNSTAASISGSNFTCDVSLTRGSNTITIVATDVAGNTRQATRTVVYKATLALVSLPGNATGTQSAVIDLGSNTVLTNLNGGAGSVPSGTAVTPDGQLGVIANSAIGTLSLVNLTTSPATITGSISTSVAIPNPEGVTLTPNGQFALISNQSDNDLISVNLQLQTIVSNIGSLPGNGGIAITPDGTRALVLDAAGNQVSVVSIGVNGALLDTSQRVGLSGLAGGARSIAITPNGKRALVTNAMSNLVTVLDIGVTTVTNIGSIGNLGAVGGLSSFNTHGLAITPDGKKVYVGNYQSSTLAILSIDVNNNVSDTSQRVFVPNGTPSPIAGVSGLAVTPDGLRLLISGFNTNQISILETATDTVQAVTIPVSNGPGGIAVAAVAAVAP
ncbi:MAG TPA: beta-propeller fold lactonase family protein [Blastocatellia bacterium]|nr:beta-propeller fold lactonase family protein [Blastocatellia bacterium]